MIFAMHDPLADLLGEWSRGLNTGSVLLRIALAVLLASVIGCERSSKRHSAGLRTFVLVSFASTVSMLLDVYLMSNFGARLPILSAATVIAAALVSGNAILFSSRSQIKGLTTSTGFGRAAFSALRSARGCTRSRGSCFSFSCAFSRAFRRLSSI